MYELPVIQNILLEDHLHQEQPRLEFQNLLMCHEGQHLQHHLKDDLAVPQQDQDVLLVQEVQDVQQVVYDLALHF